MRLSAACLFISLCMAAVDANVVMVYSVQRHAARNVLPKSANLTESDATGGPTLLPAGAKQAHDAGAAFQLRYLNPTTCASTCLSGFEDTVEPRYGLINTIQGVFNAYNTLVRSSGLDRTISTARAFLDGAFPALAANILGTGLADGQQVIPIYSLGEDPLIRAYTQCPNYVNKLSEWYSSDEFKQKEAESNATRAAIGALAPSLNVSLANWYNVWDGFLVNREYGVGNPMPAIDNATFNEMQDLAFWLETAKMRSDLTSDLLGGLLLGDIMTQMQSAQANSTAGKLYNRLVHVSSHYNVQLGLLSALAVDKSAATEDITWLRKLPEFASLMLFELHATPLNSTDPKTFAVRLVIQDGPGGNYLSIPLPCAKAGDAAETLAGPGACTLDNFIATAQPLSFPTTEQWCSACNNTIYPACKIVSLQNKLANGDASSATDACTGKDASGWQLALAAVLPALGVAILAAIMFVVYRRKVQREGLFIKEGLSTLRSGGNNNNAAWSDV